MAAGDFGFLTLIHAFDGPERYGASSFFDTMPSSPRSQTAANIFSPWPSACSTYWMPSREREQELGQSGLAFDQRPPPQIVAVAHEQIESARHRGVIVGATVQGVEIGNALRRQADHFGVEDGGALDPRDFLDDARVALGPVGGVHGVEAHPPVADVDLQPIAVVLELVRPAGTARRLLGDGRTARMDEGGGRVIRPAAIGTP